MTKAFATPLRVAADNSLSSVKASVAERLLDEIIYGRLEPGERIVEGKWAAKLHVAQASVREALNILAARGFVEKELGRSARVTKLTDEDVKQIYQVRASLESLAARLVAAIRPDFSQLDLMIADMNSAAQCRNMRSYFDRVVNFHLVLCEMSGNRFILEFVKRMIVPLQAFILLQRRADLGEGDQWYNSYEDHRRILEAVRGGDPDFAEREVKLIIEGFAGRTAEVLTRRREPPLR
jgi:DNA-binding GntR family transcriptional regulator